MCNFINDISLPSNGCRWFYVCSISINFWYSLTINLNNSFLTYLFDLCSWINWQYSFRWLIWIIMQTALISHLYIFLLINVVYIFKIWLNWLSWVFIVKFWLISTLITKELIVFNLFLLFIINYNKILPFTNNKCKISSLITKKHVSYAVKKEIFLYYPSAIINMFVGNVVWIWSNLENFNVLSVK